MNATKLHYETVKPALRETLDFLMAEDVFSPFRLVGGTSLSLRFGHRISDDIDLFSDAEYGSLDFQKIQRTLKNRFPYCQGNCGEVVGFGTTYMIGESQENAVKLDLFYTDPFIRPMEHVDSIRMASVEDIIAMKMDVLTRGGRKKDFWDLHFLCSRYSIEQLILLYLERYPYGASKAECLDGLKNFAKADGEPNPNCFMKKHWALIKLDFMEWLENL